MKGNNGRLEAISQIVEQEVSFYPQAIHRIIIKICQIEPSLTIYTKCKNIISGILQIFFSFLFLYFILNIFNIEKDQWKRARSEILVGIQRIALGLVNSESSQIEFPSDQTLKSILEIYVSEGQYPYIQQLSDYNVLNQKHALFIAGVNFFFLFLLIHHNLFLYTYLLNYFLNRKFLKITLHNFQIFCHQ